MQREATERRRAWADGERFGIGAEEAPVEASCTGARAYIAARPEMDEAEGA